MCVVYMFMRVYTTNAIKPFLLCGGKAQKGIGFSARRRGRAAHDYTVFWIFAEGGSEHSANAQFARVYCFIKTVSGNAFGTTPLHSGIDILNNIREKIFSERCRRKKKQTTNKQQRTSG